MLGLDVAVDCPAAFPARGSLLIWQGLYRVPAGTLLCRYVRPLCRSCAAVAAPPVPEADSVPCVEETFGGVALPFGCPACDVLSAVEAAPELFDFPAAAEANHLPLDF